MALKHTNEQLHQYLNTDASFEDMKVFVYSFDSPSVDLRSAIETYIGQWMGYDVEAYIHQQNMDIGYPYDDRTVRMPHTWTRAIDQYEYEEEDRNHAVSKDRVIEILEFGQFCRAHGLTDEVIDTIQTFYR